IGAPYEKNGAAEPRTGRSRSDLSGLRRALSPHHDDDHGRLDGHNADHSRLGRGSISAQRIRSGSRGRIDRLAGADLVSDAGSLSLLMKDFRNGSVVLAEFTKNRRELPHQSRRPEIAGSRPTSRATPEHEYPRTIISIRALFIPSDSSDLNHSHRSPAPTL